MLPSAALRERSCDPAQPLQAPPVPVFRSPWPVGVRGQTPGDDAGPRNRARAPCGCRVWYHTSQSLQALAVLEELML